LAEASGPTVKNDCFFAILNELNSVVEMAESFMKVIGVIFIVVGVSCFIYTKEKK